MFSKIHILPIYDMKMFLRMADVEDSPGLLRYNADGSRSVSVDDNYDRLSRKQSNII